MSQNGVPGNAEKVACITQPVSDTLASLVPVAADRGPIATRRGNTGRSWTRSRNTSRGANGWRAIFRPLAAGRTLLLSEIINLRSSRLGHQSDADGRRNLYFHPHRRQFP